MSPLTDDDRYTPSPIARPRSHSTHSTLSSISESHSHSHFPLRLSFGNNSKSSFNPMSTPTPPTAHARERSAPLPSSSVMPSHTHRVSQSQPHIAPDLNACSFNRAMRPFEVEHHGSERDDSVETTSTAHTNTSSNSSIEIISSIDTPQDKLGGARDLDPEVRSLDKGHCASHDVNLSRPRTFSTSSHSFSLNTNSYTESEDRRTSLNIPRPRPSMSSSTSSHSLLPDAHLHANKNSDSNTSINTNSNMNPITNTNTKLNDACGTAPSNSITSSSSSLNSLSMSSSRTPPCSSPSSTPASTTATTTEAALLVSTETTASASTSQSQTPTAQSSEESPGPKISSQFPLLSQPHPHVTKVAETDTPGSNSSTIIAPARANSTEDSNTNSTSDVTGDNGDTTRTPNVYINGLPPHFPDESLYLMTKDFGGVVSVRTFTRHVGERMSGYGFVLFETADAAERCIESLRRYRNLHPSFSKQIHKIPGTHYASSMSASTVTACSPAVSAIESAKSQTWRRQSVSSSCASSDMPASISTSNSKADSHSSEELSSFRTRMERLKDERSTNLYVEGLPLSIDEVTLAALVSPHVIKSSRFFQTKLSDPPRMIAFVRFETRQAAEDIIERLHGRVVRGWNDNGSRISVRFADSNEQRELRRAERIARGGEEDPSATNRLSMAHAALLNMRGAQMQAQAHQQQAQERADIVHQVQAQSAKRTPLLVPRSTAVDDFGRISSTGHLPLHPQTLPGPMWPTATQQNQHQNMNPSLLPNTNLGLGQSDGFGLDSGRQQYQHQYMQAQEYARLLESTMRGMGLSLSDLDIGGDRNRDGTRMRRSAAPMSMMQQQMRNVIPGANVAQDRQSMTASDHFAILQQQHQMQQRQQRQTLDEMQRLPTTERTLRPLMPSVDIQSDLSQYAGSREFGTHLQQQQRGQHRPQHQQHQQSQSQSHGTQKRIIDLTSTQNSRQHEYERKQALAASYATRPIPHSDPPQYASKFSSDYTRDGDGEHGDGAGGSRSPLVSPALTYTSRTPSTLSPATPFFGGSFTPASAGGGGEEAKKGEYQG